MIKRFGKQGVKPSLVGRVHKEETSIGSARKVDH